MCLEKINLQMAFQSSENFTWRGRMKDPLNKRR